MNVFAQAVEYNINFRFLVCGSNHKMGRRDALGFQAGLAGNTPRLFTISCLVSARSNGGRLYGQDYRRSTQVSGNCLIRRRESIFKTRRHYD